jgi:hypothetical protein
VPFPFRQLDTRRATIRRTRLSSRRAANEWPLSRGTVIVKLDAH